MPLGANKNPEESQDRDGKLRMTADRCQLLVSRKKRDIHEENSCNMNSSEFATVLYRTCFEGYTKSFK